MPASVESRGGNVPFRFAEKKNTDGLPDGITEEEFRKLIVAVVDDGVKKLMREALRPHLYSLTGNVDYLPETTQDRPRGKK